MRISDWSSDVCSSDLHAAGRQQGRGLAPVAAAGIGLQPDQALGHDDAHAVGVATYREAGPDRDHPVAGRGDHERPPGIPCCVEERFAALQVDAALAARKCDDDAAVAAERSEEHTSELQSLMRNSYAVLRLKKKQK